MPESSYESTLPWAAWRERGDIGTYRCTHLRLLGEQAGGRELYICEIRNIRLGSPSPDLCFKCESYEPDFEMPPERFIRLDWIGCKKDVDQYRCSWKLSVSGDVLERRDLEAVREWTDGKVKTSGQIGLKKAGVRSYDLEIVGKGYDNRCRWCASFRTALNTRTNNIVEKRGFCPSEKTVLIPGFVL